MLTDSEKARMRLIKHAAKTGRAHEVSRADKQWVLDVAAREQTAVPFKAAVMALAEGYDVSHVYTTAAETVAV